MAISIELKQIKLELCGSKNQWRWFAAKEIDSVPRGRLATYGYIANVVNGKYGLSISARNVGWLRKYLYGKLSHDTNVPLHRIAKQGDVLSCWDSDETKACNAKKRGEEGSIKFPKWMK